MSALLGVRLGVCVVRQNAGISHARRWRRKSELLIKQRQQLIKTLLHSLSVTSLVSPPLLQETQGLLVCFFSVFFQTRQRCSLIPLTADMLEEDNDEICWNNLENFRVKLISVIDPSRITPYLRQCKVLSPDDEEQVLNDPSLVMRKRKAGGSTSNIFVGFPLVWDCLGN